MKILETICKIIIIGSIAFSFVCTFLATPTETTILSPAYKQPRPETGATIEHAIKGITVYVTPEEEQNLRNKKIATWGGLGVAFLFVAIFNIFSKLRSKTAHT